MSDIIATINRFENISAGKGVSEEQLQEASKELNLSFSREYQEYLRTYGMAFVDGHELTGIGIAKSADVVKVTMAKRALQHVNKIPDDWYVVEDTYIDGIVIWQSEKGDIYRESPGCIQKISDSLADYLKKDL